MDNQQSPIGRGESVLSTSDPDREFKPLLTVFPKDLWCLITFLRVMFVLAIPGTFFGIPWMGTVFIGSGLFLGGLMAVGMFMPNSNLFGFVFSRGRADLREVALTFDDGPDPLTTPKVLDILKLARISATFFVIGERADRHADIVRRMVAEGHQVENHTWRHPVTQAVWPINHLNRIVRELKHTNELIENIGGIRPRFVRFPAGIKSIPTMRAVTRLGLIVAGFSVRAFDSRRIEPKDIVISIKKKCFPGAVILLHDGGWGCNGMSSIVQALPEILSFMRENNYRCVRLDSLFSRFCHARTTMNQNAVPDELERT